MNSPVVVLAATAATAGGLSLAAGNDLAGILQLVGAIVAAVLAWLSGRKKG